MDINSKGKEPSYQILSATVLKLNNNLLDIEAQENHNQKITCKSVSGKLCLLGISLIGLVGLIGSITAFSYFKSPNNNNDIKKLDPLDYQNNSTLLFNLQPDWNNQKNSTNDNPFIKTKGPQFLDEIGDEDIDSNFDYNDYGSTDEYEYDDQN